VLAFILSVTAAVLLLAMPAGAQDAPAAPRRVALIMGNDTYRSLNPLSNPRLDAGRLAALLDANGFEVIRCDGKHLGCFDLTRAGMLDALETLQEKARGADLALVLYAGHGMEGRDGNVLAPIDMEVIDCTTRALRRGVPLEELFKAAAGARQRIVVLDASRENPLAQCAAQDPPQRGHSPVSFGPLPTPEAESLLLVSSAKPGQVASDGLPGTHSPFARALLQWLSGLPRRTSPGAAAARGACRDRGTSREGVAQVPEALVRGAAPDVCLKGTDCVGDMRAAVLEQELEALKQKHNRDQELAAIAQGYLAQAGKPPPPSEAERKLDLRRLKDVRDFILEAGKGRGRPFSSEERAQELQRVMEAGRALIALDDARAGQALERLAAGDESAAKRLLAEIAETRKQAASTAEARAAEENREAAKALRHLAAIAEPRSSAEAADHYKEATRLDPADAETWIGYGRAAFFAGRRDEAKAAYERAAAAARESGNVRAQYAAAYALGGLASGPEREQHYRRALALADVAARANPGSLASQSWLSESYRAIGGVLLEQGKLPDALESFRASLAIAERLAMADPADIQRQRDLAAVHNLLGQAFGSRASSGVSQEAATR
jgi:tetratricopeptide (TPR) repeat protein